MAFDKIIFFEYYFNLRLKERFDRLFLRIFAVVSAVFLTIIIIIANLNYHAMRQEMNSKVLDRYKRLVSELILPESVPAPEPETIIEEEIKLETLKQKLSSVPPSQSRADERDRIAEQVQQDNEIFQSGQSNDPYAYLPDPDDLDIGEGGDGDVVELTRPSGSMRYLRQRRGDMSRYDPGELEAILRKPFNYNLTRKGNVYIEVTDELIERDSKEPEGYRDPDEIERVIYKYQDMIQHCFEKEQRYQSKLHGYIKVQFGISPRGFVIPETIKILSSTIRNRHVEQCIKNYIKRWRGFEKLDDSMGIATVVQKFVFN